MSESTGLAGLLSASQSVLALAGFRPQRLPSDYVSRRHALPSGEVAIDTWIHADGCGNEARLALICSPKIEIVTTFLYPIAGRSAPLYAMELVRLGPKPVVAVMDCAAPADDPSLMEAQALLAAVRREAPGLVQADDPPDWFVEARSGADLFFRPKDVAALHRAGLLHLSLWTTLLLRLAAAPAREVDAALAFASFARHYKDHHRMHSPGIPLLTKCFGGDWTAGYLADCFFR
ncbi:MAG: hypothetical protein MUE46_04640 [Xanthomonadales bacterium]|jgi:hypothetical protein|nr:hypothetical protein [Xanthomonadales bacterium]